MHLFSWNIFFLRVLSLSLSSLSSQGVSWKDEGVGEMGASTILPTGCEMEEHVGMGRELGMNPKWQYKVASTPIPTEVRAALPKYWLRIYTASAFSFISAIKSLRRFKNHWGVMQKIQPQVTDGIHAQVLPRQGWSPPLQGVWAVTLPVCLLDCKN